MINADEMFQLLNNVEKDDNYRPGWRHEAGIVKILSENKFAPLSSGLYKRVWACPYVDYVVKIHSLNGDGAHEAENYETAPAWLQEVLVPITQGTGFQIQRRVRMISCHDTCFVPDMEDSSNVNHTHDEKGAFVVFDYGQIDPWQEGAHSEEYADEENS